MGPQSHLYPRPSWHAQRGEIMEEGLFRGHQRLFFALLANFVVFGVTVTILGATVPKVIRQFGWSYLVTGAILSSTSVGYFLSTFASGFLIRRLDHKRVILLGLFLQAAGLAVFGAVPDVFVNLIAAVSLGIGQGATEVVTNSCVAEMERPGQSRLMSLMHAAFPLGAISGPLLIGWLISVGRSWQVLYRAMAGMSLLLAGGLYLVSFKTIGRVEREDDEHPPTIGLLRSPLLLFLFLTIFLYVGSEIGVSSWVSEYYVKVFGTSVSAGAYMVSVFWFGVLVGRLSVSLGYRGYRQAELLLFLSTVSLLSLLASLMLKAQVTAAFGFLMTGLGYSAIYPVIMAIVGENFKRGQSVAIGIVSTGGGLGSFSFPFIMAAIANSYGIRSGLWFYVATTLGIVIGAAIVLWLTWVRSRSRDSDDPQERKKNGGSIWERRGHE